jgi:hypothetical protein
MKVPRADKENFNYVFAGFHEGEVETIKELYRADPESWRAQVARLADEKRQTESMKAVLDPRFVPLTPNSYPVAMVKRA